MAQTCLKCLKYIMCAVNFLFFISGVIMLGFGIYMSLYQTSALLPSVKFVTATNLLLTTGIVVTCVSFLGFVGALKENRCFLLTFFILLLILMLVELVVACVLLFYQEKIENVLRDELTQALEEEKTSNVSSHLRSDWDLVQEWFDCCGVYNITDWGDKTPDSCCLNHHCDTKPYEPKGCLKRLTEWFEDNFLKTGIAVIVLCVCEVLGMCIAMTLFCHISSSGLGYKL